ncbi:acyltransferase, partial [Escherichia coli]|nr:acyltransferase [Escherichia coli]
GGFSGVDVFFVISGFLMTKIIFDGIQSNKFSLLGFYSARCRRIIPALTVLCFVLMLFGWFSFNAKDFDSIAVNGVGSIFFLSNVLYWSQSSYFGAEAHSNWLLHTWSLSVEWQFYLVYPIIILAATRIKDASIAKILVISIMIMSLACSIFLTARWPTMSFYLLITRAWEMMAGGIAYFIGCKISNKFKKTTELLGITLIL